MRSRKHGGLDTRGPLQRRHVHWTFSRQPSLESGTIHGPSRAYPWSVPSVLAAPCPSPCPRQFVLDHPGEVLQRLDARDHTAVDAAGRGTGHPGTGALVYVLLHGGLVCPAPETLLEGRQVQPHLLGRGLALLRTGLRRIGAERVVRGPKLPLLIGAPRRLVRLARLVSTVSTPPVSLPSQHCCWPRA